ncbi:hypothetical protein BN1708_001961 [Verticillium longisporum]|uniref:Uncharacterized protein n=1 Tax=Verticillium longisporum TaxID=100787 RepID=A0A0G4KEH8_VERLO|nr:hypothetical protein BN1708_001961 [Verticillium longisporum]
MLPGRILGEDRGSRETRQSTHRDGGQKGITPASCIFRPSTRVIMKTHKNPDMASGDIRRPPGAIRRTLMHQAGSKPSRRISTAAAGALWLFPSFYVTVQPLLHCQIAAHQQPSSLQSSCSINGATKAGSPQSSTNLQQF